MKVNEAGLYEVEIDGKVYEFQKWKAKSSMQTFSKILALIGEPVGELFGGMMSGDKLDAKIKKDVIAKAFGQICEKMDDPSVLPTIEKLCTDLVLCQGVQIKSFDQHYASIMHIIKVAKANLEVQYGDFLGEFLDKVGDPQGAVIVRAPQT